MQAEALHEGERMRLPKPKSAPGILLYTITAAALLLIARIVWVLVGQNVETVSAEKGYDKLLSRHWSEIMDWLAVNGFWLSLLTAAFVGGTLFLWGYVALQPGGERQPAGPADSDAAQRDKIARINSYIAETYKTLGMAIGAQDRLTYDLAIVQSETFLLDLSRRNNIHIPDLRSDGTEAGTYRVLCYLNEIVPALQLDDDVEARARAARLVPKLNAKNADQLRSDLGLPAKHRPFPDPGPALTYQPATVPPPTDEDGFNYPYKKAVIQAEIPKAKRTAEAQAGSMPHRLTILMALKNTHTKPLKNCYVFLINLTKEDGTSVAVGEPLMVRKQDDFTLGIGSDQQIRLLTRDISDRVTPEPFMIHLASRQLPLAENTRYFAAIELRSRYPHPTLLIVQIDTGVGLDAHAAIVHQGFPEDK